MKKLLAVAAVAALISAPAFAAAPEAFSVDIGSSGQMRASPPGASAEAEQQGSATWSQAASPGRPSAQPATQGSGQGAQMMRTSDEPAAPAPKKKKHHKKKAAPAAPGGEAPKAAPAPAPAPGQGQQ